MKSINSFRVITLLLVVVQSLLLTSISHAWPRYPYTDPQIVERAELIVVAHVKDDSLTFVYHKEDDHGYSYQYNATLIITEYLKGTSAQTELPIIIHHGLVPYAFSESNRGKSRQFGAKSFEHGFEPSATIVLEDNGGEGGMISGNIRADQIWFLRHKQRKDQGYSGSDTTDEVGIWDPQDVQQIGLKLYFQALLTEHPENKLKEYAIGDSPLAMRSQVYLNHLKIAEILKEPNVTKRAAGLLPLCLFTDKRLQGHTQQEALQQLTESCGEVGAKSLLPIFKDPKYKEMQTEIMYAWAGAKYHDSIPTLIDLLKVENAFWKKQTPAKLDLWVHMGPYHGPTMPQILSRNRIETVLEVFTQLADPRAKRSVEETKLLWEKLFGSEAYMNFDAQCDRALAAIEDAERRK